MLLFLSLERQKKRIHFFKRAIPTFKKKKKTMPLTFFKTKILLRRPE